MKTTFSVIESLTESVGTEVVFMSEALAEEVNILDVHGKEGTVFVNYLPDAETQIIVGTGKVPVYLSEEPDFELSSKNKVMLTNGVYKAINKAIELKRKDIVVKVPKHFDEVVVLAAMNATYNFDDYKTDKADRLDSVKFWFDGGTLAENTDLIIKTRILAESIELTKNLQNANANLMTPSMIEEECAVIANNSNIDMKVILAYNNYSKLGLLRAVGKASEENPRLIILEYRGDDSTDESVVLVGKGITYDSGGLSLKPSDSMLDMKMDMSGAAVVMGVMNNISKNNEKINLTVLIPAAENAIGPNAYRVGDVISGYSGKTVEVKNTDAEGRLILADALSYAVDKYKIKSMVDIATLTGAIVSALGDNIAGVFKSDNAVEELEILKECSKSTTEQIWELPLNDDIRDGMKSKIADISNMSKIKGHGSSSAAAFLEAFVGDTKWIHLDVAGTAMRDNAGTGWGVNLLSQYVRKAYK